MEVPHGCEGSATTEVAVRVPERAVTRTSRPHDTDRWTAPVTDEGVTFRTEHAAA